MGSYLVKGDNGKELDFRSLLSAMWVDYFKHQPLVDSKIELAEISDASKSTYVSDIIIDEKPAFLLTAENKQKSVYGALFLENQVHGFSN